MTVVVPQNRRERRIARRIETSIIEQPTTKLPSIVASAVNVRVTQTWANQRWGGSEAQSEGWVHYDTCPEFHAGVDIGAGNLSRARLIGVEIDPETNEQGTQPTMDPTVTDIMAKLFGGPGGQSQALEALFRHLTVAGEAWILATDNPDVDQSPWEILSSTEVSGSQTGRVNIEQMDGVPRPVDFDRELLIRVWQPHPRRRWEADSPTRSLLPVLRELAALTAMVSATVKSRLASAGILWLPDDITLPSAINETDAVTQTRIDAAGGAEGWLDLITEAMTTPIRDPDSAAAVVPMVAQVKGDSIAKILHMEFGKDLDTEIEPLREAGVKRLAVGMNLPPSILLGQETSTHWNAWQITEDYARAYLAPKLELIAAALTQFYLRPSLIALGIDPDRYAVYFDLDALLPNQQTVENAVQLWHDGILKDDIYAETLGFSVSQMKTPAEKLQDLMLDVLKNHPNFELIAELAPTLVRAFPGLVIVPIAPATDTISKPESTASPVDGVQKPVVAPVAAPPKQVAPPTSTVVTPPAQGS